MALILVDDPWFAFPHKSKSPVQVYIGDCLTVLAERRTAGMHYDAIVTDPPYELNLHNKAWDNTGITFSRELWTLLFDVLKPGGFVAAFSAPRLYHRMAVAAEDAGFTMYPFLVWNYDSGVPKPANVSELFDRDVLTEREIIGYKSGSGYTQANVDQGAQNRSKTKFPVYARHVSAEAKQWQGYYYGVNCLMPSLEPIMLAQKPIDQPRTIDNLRVWGTGALNLGVLRDRYGKWPNNILKHDKARRIDHQSDHPSVKPVPLLEDICALVCPSDGHIIDPFAGTGTTGIATQRAGFNCTLIENNPAMKSVIVRRLGLDERVISSVGASEYGPFSEGC
jgi:site-specific DNA-methyltransferase (adenine-specific)